MDRLARDLADQVVQRDVEGALRRAVPADRVLQPVAASRRAGRRRVGSTSPTASSRSGKTAAIVPSVSP